MIPCGWRHAIPHHAVQLNRLATRRHHIFSMHRSSCISADLEHLYPLPLSHSRLLSSTKKNTNNSRSAPFWAALVGEVLLLHQDKSPIMPLWTPVLHHSINWLGVRKAGTESINHMFADGYQVTGREDVRPAGSGFWSFVVGRLRRSRVAHDSSLCKLSAF